MANARRDENDRPVNLGVNRLDNSTPLMLHVDPVTSYLLATVATDEITIVGSKHRIDENDVPTMYGISSTDGTTLIPIHTANDGTLLAQLT